MSLAHGVWKSQKKSYSTLRAKRATFTFWVDKSLLKMPKMVHFGEFLKTCSLRSNIVTRQVSLNRTKLGGKCQNSNTTFWVIFKQCVTDIKWDFLTEFPPIAVPVPQRKFFLVAHVPISKVWLIVFLCHCVLSLGSTKIVMHQSRWFCDDRYNAIRHLVYHNHLR